MFYNNIELIAYDFDGVMTNNCVHVSQDGEEFVTCNRGDGLGINMLKARGIRQIIISTEKNEVVNKRAKKVGIDAIYGVDNKKMTLSKYCKDNKISLEQVMYVGNDLNDLSVMKIVGIPVCPSDAHVEIKNISKISTHAKGGEGVIRELADIFQMQESEKCNNIQSSSLSDLNKTHEVMAQMEDSVALRKTIMCDEKMIQWIVELSDVVIECLKRGGKIIFAGNGGSFADSQHLAAEFVGRFIVEREPLAAICLGTNGSLSTAIGNDYSFENIFSRELKGVATNNDVLIVLSTSGNSENIIDAVNTARHMDISTYGLLGKDGGVLSKLVENIIIPSEHTARIQEMHITIGHILCDLIDRSDLTKLNN